MSDPPLAALQELAALPYLPFGDRSVGDSVDALRALPRVVEDRLQVRLLRQGICLCKGTGLVARDGDGGEQEDRYGNPDS